MPTKQITAKPIEHSAIRLAFDAEGLVTLDVMFSDDAGGSHCERLALETMEKDGPKPKAGAPIDATAARAILAAAYAAGTAQKGFA